jgi:hypothetical protein
LLLSRKTRRNIMVVEMMPRKISRRNRRKFLWMLRKNFKGLTAASKG